MTMITDNARTYLNSFVRDVKQIDTLRRIELSFLVIGLSVALAQDSWRAFLVVGGTLVVLFAGFELGIRGEMQLRNAIARACARQEYLDADEPSAASPILLEGRAPLALRLSAALHVLTLPQFYAWQLGLVVCLALLSFLCP